MIKHQSKIEMLIAELCPSGVEFKELGEIGRRNHGTNITASKMADLQTDNAPIRIFAGGKTIADVPFGSIPDEDIIKDASIIVKSRGYIGFEYYDKPFSHKNELWSYTIQDGNVNQKFVYYYLLTQVKKLQRKAKACSVKLPQLSVGDTDNFKIPLPPLAIQEEIVKILNSFTELEAELEARKKQYEYYRLGLLTFNERERDG